MFESAEMVRECCGTSVKFVSFIHLPKCDLGRLLHLLNVAFLDKRTNVQPGNSRSQVHLSLSQTYVHNKAREEAAL